MAKNKSKKIIQVPIEDDLLKRIDATRVLSPRAARPLFVKPVSSA
jgi:hypothetical protein